MAITIIDVAAVTKKVGRTRKDPHPDWEAILEAYPKLAPGKGLQVPIPLNATGQPKSPGGVGNRIRAELNERYPDRKARVKATEDGGLVIYYVVEQAPVAVAPAAQAPAAPPAPASAAPATAPAQGAAGVARPPQIPQPGR